VRSLGWKWARLVWRWALWAGGGFPGLEVGFLGWRWVPWAGSGFLGLEVGSLAAPSMSAALMIPCHLQSRAGKSRASGCKRLCCAWQGKVEGSKVETEQKLAPAVIIPPGILRDIPESEHGPRHTQRTPSSVIICAANTLPPQKHTQTYRKAAAYK